MWYGWVRGCNKFTLYAAPAAVATWRSTFGLGELAQLACRVASRVTNALSRQREHIYELVHRIPLLLATESAHAPSPLFNLESLNKSITGDYPACLILSTFVFQPEASLDVGKRRLNLELLDELEGPTSLVVCEPPAYYDDFALSSNIRADELYIIIHVRACLIGLLVACCVVFTSESIVFASIKLTDVPPAFVCVKFTLRLVLHLARSSFSPIHSKQCRLRTPLSQTHAVHARSVLPVSGWSMAKYLLRTVLEILVDIQYVASDNRRFAEKEQEEEEEGEQRVDDRATISPSTWWSVKVRVEERTGTPERVWEEIVVEGGKEGEKRTTLV
ncbi:hypothetical protein FRC10_005513 [Ceratobasidium sp. 414]|nr:hypothetical protein FRC10_005513 [Ceratobasidium sp. 414]